MNVKLRSIPRVARMDGNNRICAPLIERVEGDGPVKPGNRPPRGCGAKSAPARQPGKIRGSVGVAPRYLFDLSEEVFFWLSALSCQRSAATPGYLTSCR